MSRARAIFCSLLLAMLWFGLSSSSIASSENFKVIVHPDNPVNVVERAWLRDVYLKKTLKWRHGPHVRPIGLSTPRSVHENFTEHVLDKTEAQLRNYWIQRIFSGTGVPPPEAASANAAVSYVLANPGAVAYVPVEADTAGARVVQAR